MDWANAAHPDGGEPEVEVELIDGEIVHGRLGYKYCAIRASHNGEAYEAEVRRILGEGSRARITGDAFLLKRGKYKCQTIPVADVPKWFKKVIKMYYPMAKIGVS